MSNFQELEKGAWRKKNKITKYGYEEDGREGEEEEEELIIFGRWGRRKDEEEKDTWAKN